MDWRIKNKAKHKRIRDQTIQNIVNDKKLKDEDKEIRIQIK